MPLPKVRDGQTLTLVLPADVVRRIKLEALDTGAQPTVIVQKALESYWRVGSADSASGLPSAITHSDEVMVTPSIQPIPIRQMKQLVIMDAMLAEGRFTEQEFITAIGKTPSALRAEWIKNKFGAPSEVVKVEKFISSKCISRKGYLALIEATRIPVND